MDQDLPFMEIGLAAMVGDQTIADQNLTILTVRALALHPENIVEILLTSLMLFGEQEANSKLLLHVERLAVCLEEKNNPERRWFMQKKPPKKRHSKACVHARFRIFGELARRKPGIKNNSAGKKRSFE